jgi:nucleoside-diphosphate-sugar epimerase
MMKVFAAGTTGAIGEQLVPRLVAAGHGVHGMTRGDSKQATLRELGAIPVVAGSRSGRAGRDASQAGCDCPSADRDRVGC